MTNYRRRTINNAELAIEMIGNYLKQIESAEEEGKKRYSKLCEVLKNTKELLESLMNLNEEEARAYMDSFFVIMSS